MLETCWFGRGIRQRLFTLSRRHHRDVGALLVRRLDTHVAINGKGPADRVLHQPGRDRNHDPSCRHRDSLPPLA